MKKLVIIGLVVALSAAVGASVMTGRVFQEQLHNLAAEIAKDPRIQVVDNKVNEGMFSSSGSMTIAMNLEEGQRLLFESPWQASHLPGWVTYKGQTLLNLELGDEEILNLLDELGMDALEYEGTAGWKKATYAMAVEPFLFEDAYSKVEVTGFDLSGTYYYSGHQISKLLVKQIALLEKGYATTKLELNDVALSWNQKGSYPWVEGNAELIADRIYFLSPQGEVELTKASWSQQLVFNAQTFDYAMSLDLGEVKSQGDNLGTGKLTLRTKDFNGQAVANLIEAATTNSNLKYAAEEDAQAVLSAVDLLLSGSPALVLEEFKLDLQTPFKFEQQATGELSFDGNNLPINYLLQLEEGRLDSEDPISRIRLELNFSKLEPALLMLVGIPPTMLNSDQDEQKLVFEAGELTLNGQLLPF